MVSFHSELLACSQNGAKSQFVFSFFLQEGLKQSNLGCPTGAGLRRESAQEFISADAADSVSNAGHLHSLTML